MNVLFTCVVGCGHFHPMVPLALALRDAGHTVVVATDPSAPTSSASDSHRIRRVWTNPTRGRGFWRPFPTSTRS
jgi:hypothetical protein